MSEYKIFAKKISLIGIVNILVALNSFILLPILTKYFSVSDYGVWVQVLTTISLLPNIVTLGLPYTLIRFLSPEKNEKKIQEGFYSILIIILIVTSAVSLLIFIFSHNISLLFGGNVEVAKILAFLVFFNSLNLLCLSFFRTLNQIRKYSTFLLIQTYLGTLLIYILILCHYNVAETIIGLLIANIITFIIMITIISAYIKFKIPKFVNMKEYLSYGLPIIPSNLSYWIVDSSDRYIIGLLLGMSFVGYYSPGYSLGNFIILILAPFSFLLPTILPQYHIENNIEKINTFLKYSIKYFLLIAIPASIALSLLSKPILLIITTEEIALNGYYVTPFIALSALLYGIYGIISNIILLEKKTKVLGIIWIIAALFNITLTIILVPFIGILGAALTTLISYVIAFSVTLYYSYKFFKFEFDIRFIIKSISSAIIMALIILLLEPKTIISIIISISIAFAVYLVLLLLLKGITKAEIIFFMKLIKNKS